MQVYTVAKDGALCVWECSLSLSEMTTLVEKHQRQKRGGAELEGGDKGEENDEIPDDPDGDDMAAIETEGANDDTDDQDETPPNSKKPRLLPNLCHWSKTAKWVIQSVHNKQAIYKAVVFS